MACVEHFCPSCGEIDFNNSWRRQFYAKCGESMRRIFDEPPERDFDEEWDREPEDVEEDDA